MKYTLLVIMALSCNKNLLEKPPSGYVEIPSSLAHLKGLLTNREEIGETPVLGEQSSDDYYLSDNLYDALSLKDKSVYTWQNEPYGGQSSIPDWSKLYRQVHIANIVLEELAKIKLGDQDRQLWNEVKGSALFLRSYSLFNIAQVFALPYNDQTADKDLGVVIPVSSDQNMVYKRSNIRDSYDTIINNLLRAATLLSPKLVENIWPCRAAAYGLLARVCLSMRNYTGAEAYADSCLGYYDSLIDYNSLNVAEPYPFKATNRETLYQSCMIKSNLVIKPRYRESGIVDSTLYGSYQDADLRKSIFFHPNGYGQFVLKASYTADLFAFSGIATDEIYLVRAECNARRNNLPAALEDINHLLKLRHKTGEYVPYSETNQQAVFKFILTERRKELIFRGLRWMDLRRFNMEEAEITLTRVINGNMYQLLPHDRRYALPVPADALKGSLIEQNPR